MNEYPEFMPTTEQVREGYADDPESEYRDPIGYPAMLRENRRIFDRWLEAHDAALLADSTEELDRTKRGARTLGEIVQRQVEDTLRWAGMEDQIGTDDPDQQLAWERCAEMPGRIAQLEAEVSALRAKRNPNPWSPEWVRG